MTTAENRFWGSDWDELRRHWSIDPNQIFLNHGSFGATPIPVQRAQQEWHDRLERQPVQFLVRDLPGLLQAAREKCSALLNCEAGDLVFVPNATFGINHVIRSLPIEPGDEIVVTDQVYPAVYHTMRRICDEAGACLIMQEIPLPQDPDDSASMAQSFLEALTPRTKFVVIEHIASCSGLIMPVKRIVDECRKRGILCMVDAAHAPGMLDVNIRELNPDFWTGNYHKWVCAPKVSAGLYVRRDLQDQIQPIITSNYADQGFQKEFGWVGTHDPSPYLATPTAIEFMASLDWNRVRHHNHELVRYGRKVVSEAIGTPGPIFDSEKYYGSMALVALPDSIRLHSEEDAEAFRQKFHDATKIEATFMAWRDRGWLRLSAQVYNYPAQYDQLADALASWLKA